MAPRRRVRLGLRRRLRGGAGVLGGGASARDALPPPLARLVGVPLRPVARVRRDPDPGRRGDDRADPPLPGRPARRRRTRRGPVGRLRRARKRREMGRRERAAAPLPRELRPDAVGPAADPAPDRARDREGRPPPARAPARALRVRRRVRRDAGIVIRRSRRRLRVVAEPRPRRGPRLRRERALLPLRRARGASSRAPSRGRVERAPPPLPPSPPREDGARRDARRGRDRRHRVRRARDARRRLRRERHRGERGRALLRRLPRPRAGVLRGVLGDVPLSSLRLRGVLLARRVRRRGVGARGAIPLPPADARARRRRRRRAAPRLARHARGAVGAALRVRGPVRDRGGARRRTPGGVDGTGTGTRRRRGGGGLQGGGRRAFGL